MAGYIVNFVHPERHFTAAFAHMYSRRKKALCQASSYVTVFATKRAARQAINDTIPARQAWLKKNMHDGRSDDIYTNPANYHIERLKAA